MGMKPLSFKQRIICWLAYALTRVLHASYRYRWYGLENYESASKSSPLNNPIIAVWHQNALTSVLSHAHRRMGVVVSRSFDGEVIASVAARFGIVSARGSSHRGGLEALRDIIKLIRNGYEAGITVDGPTGPIHQVKPGVIAIASMTGATVLPFAALAERRWIFTMSWDQFRLPRPGTRIHCIYGTPIVIAHRSGKEEQEAQRLQLESNLMALEDLGERWRREGFPQQSQLRGMRPPSQKS